MLGVTTGSRFQATANVTDYNAESRFGSSYSSQCPINRGTAISHIVDPFMSISSYVRSKPVLKLFGLCKTKVENESNRWEHNAHIPRHGRAEVALANIKIVPHIPQELPAHAPIPSRAACQSVSTSESLMEETRVEGRRNRYERLAATASPAIEFFCTFQNSFQQSSISRTDSAQVPKRTIASSVHRISEV